MRFEVSEKSIFYEQDAAPMPWYGPIIALSIVLFTIVVIVLLICYSKK